MNGKVKELVLLVAGAIAIFLVLQSDILNNFAHNVKLNVQNPLSTPSSDVTRVLLGGDVMLGRSVTVQTLDRERDPSYPFDNMQKLFSLSDLIVFNLENPVVEKCPRRNSGMVFCAPPEMLEAFKGHNILVNLANNHTLNYGMEGYTETKKHLGDINIPYTDSKTFHTMDINGTTFGFLGFDKAQQSNPALSDAEKKLLTESSQKVDILLISIHWGVEYQKHPLEGQKRLAQELVNLGADIIVGHHPHWVQDIEMIGEVPVYYSLGNLVFDQMWSEETRKGLLILLTVKNKKIVSEEKYPTYIQNLGQPVLKP